MLSLFLQVFKITLNSPNNRAPELSLVRDQVFEAAHKVWLNYVDMERKATCKVPWELHNQIQSVSTDCNHCAHMLLFLFLFKPVINGCITFFLI